MSYGHRRNYSTEQKLKQYTLVRKDKVKNIMGNNHLYCGRDNYERLMQLMRDVQYLRMNTQS